MNKQPLYPIYLIIGRHDSQRVLSRFHSMIIMYYQNKLPGILTHSKQLIRSNTNAITIKWRNYSIIEHTQKNFTTATKELGLDSRGDVPDKELADQSSSVNRHATEEFNFKQFSKLKPTNIDELLTYSIKYLEGYCPNFYFGLNGKALLSLWSVLENHAQLFQASTMTWESENNLLKCVKRTLEYYEQCSNSLNTIMDNLTTHRNNIISFDMNATQLAALFSISHYALSFLQKVKLSDNLFSSDLLTDFFNLNFKAYTCQLAFLALGSSDLIYRAQVAFKEPHPFSVPLLKTNPQFFNIYSYHLPTKPSSTSLQSYIYSVELFFNRYYHILNPASLKPLFKYDDPSTEFPRKLRRNLLKHWFLNTKDANYNNFPVSGFNLIDPEDPLFYMYIDYYTEAFSNYDKDHKHILSLIKQFARFNSISNPAPKYLYSILSQIRHGTINTPSVFSDLCEIFSFRQYNVNAKINKLLKHQKKFQKLSIDLTPEESLSFYKNIYILYSIRALSDFNFNINTTTTSSSSPHSDPQEYPNPLYQMFLYFPEENNKQKDFSRALNSFHTTFRSHFQNIGISFSRPILEMIFSLIFGFSMNEGITVFNRESQAKGYTKFLSYLNISLPPNPKLVTRITYVSQLLELCSRHKSDIPITHPETCLSLICFLTKISEMASSNSLGKSALTELNIILQSITLSNLFDDLKQQLPLYFLPMEACWAYIYHLDILCDKLNNLNRTEINSFTEKVLSFKKILHDQQFRYRIVEPEELAAEYDRLNISMKERRLKLFISDFNKLENLEDIIHHLNVFTTLLTRTQYDDTELKKLITPITNKIENSFFDKTSFYHPSLTLKIASILHSAPFYDNNIWCELIKLSQLSGSFLEISDLATYCELKKKYYQLSSGIKDEECTNNLDLLNTNISTHFKLKKLSCEEFSNTLFITEYLRFYSYLSTDLMYLILPYLVSSLKLELDNTKISNIILPSSTKVFSNLEKCKCITLAIADTIIPISSIKNEKISENMLICNNLATQALKLIYEIINRDTLSFQEISFEDQVLYLWSMCLFGLFDLPYFKHLLTKITNKLKKPYENNWPLNYLYEISLMLPSHHTKPFKYEYYVSMVRIRKHQELIRKSPRSKNTQHSTAISIEKLDLWEKILKKSDPQYEFDISVGDDSYRIYRKGEIKINTKADSPAIILTFPNFWSKFKPDQALASRNLIISKSHKFQFDWRDYQDLEGSELSDKISSDISKIKHLEEEMKTEKKKKDGTIQSTKED